MNHSYHTNHKTNAWLKKNWFDFLYLYYFSWFLFSFIIIIFIVRWPKFFIVSSFRASSSTRRSRLDGTAKNEKFREEISLLCTMGWRVDAGGGKEKVSSAFSRRTKQNGHKNRKKPKDPQARNEIKGKSFVDKHDFLQCEKKNNFIFFFFFYMYVKPSVSFAASRFVFVELFSAFYFSFQELGVHHIDWCALHIEKYYFICV